MRLFALCCILVGIAKAKDPFQQEIDIKQPITQAQVNCLKANNISTVYARAYTSANGGMFDYNICNTYKAVSQTNIFPDLYMEPSVSGGKTAKDQFNEMYSGLTSPQCNYHANYFWLWVVSPQNWKKDPTVNVRFIKDIIDAALAKLVFVGIYTNENDWKTITQNTDHHELGAGRYPYGLWLANGTKSGQDPHSLNGFNPFGGFTINDICSVQYSQNENICGIACNRDFGPS